MFVTSEKCVRVSVGGVAVVHGGIFTPGCKAVVNDVSIDPIEVTSNEFSFVAPAEVQETSFVIKNGTVTSSSIRLVVVANADLQTYKIEDRTAYEFNNHVRGLLPRGFNFAGEYFGKVISGIAFALKYAYGIFRDVVKQSSPYTTEDLNSWEKELGLPRGGLEFVTDDDRRQEILRLSRTRCGMTLPYYRQLLDLYGKDYEIYEYWKNPEKFPDWVATQYGERAKFFVLFKIYQTEFAQGMTCISKCNASLGGERDVVLERLLNFYKPAHVQFIFEYSIIADEERDSFETDDGELLTV